MKIKNSSFKDYKEIFIDNFDRNHQNENNITLIDLMEDSFSKYICNDSGR